MKLGEPVYKVGVAEGCAQGSLFGKKRKDKTEFEVVFNQRFDYLRRVLSVFKITCRLFRIQVRTSVGSRFL